MLKVFIAILISYSLLSRDLVYAAATCLASFASSEQNIAKPEKVELDATTNLIAYIGALLEHRVISDQELVQFISGLEQGNLINPISEQQSQVSSAYLIHHNGLEKHLKNQQLDLMKLLDWSKSALKERERVKVRREETKVETQEIFQKMEFNRVEAGEFEMGEDGKKVHVKIAEPFELMSTPVTQRQWLMIMGENPSQFVNYDQTVELNINGKKIKAQPDHPVEQVSWDDSQEFINRLNDRSAAGDPLLVQLIAGHKRGDQYRLPMEAEWEYVVTDRGRAQGRWYFGDNEADLEDYGWVDKNSGGMTHAVGDRKPIIVDGKAFYDMYGNVWEWQEDKVGKGGSKRIFLGGSWIYYAKNCRSAFHENDGPDAHYPDVGFRLLRIIKP